LLTVQEHLETWLAHCRDSHDDDGPVPEYVEREFRRYLECGILAYGFARARCGQCGHDFLIAFSCKGRGVCPSCNGRRMVETAAHLTDNVLPRLPVRQWVLAVPKRLRYFLERDAELQGAALRLFLRVVERPPAARRRAGACRRPPACPRAATPASAPAPKYNDTRADQPVATENRRLTCPTDSPTLKLACLKWLSFRWTAGAKATLGAVAPTRRSQIRATLDATSPLPALERSVHAACNK
jgi:hypothetical protein